MKMATFFCLFSGINITEELFCYDEHTVGDKGNDDDAV